MDREELSPPAPYTVYGKRLLRVVVQLLAEVTNLVAAIDRRTAQKLTMGPGSWCPVASWHFKNQLKSLLFSALIPSSFYWTSFPGPKIIKWISWISNFSQQMHASPSYPSTHPIQPPGLKLPDIRCNSLCQESCRVLSQAPLGHSPSMCCCDTRLEDEGGSLGESCSCNNQSTFKERDGKSPMYVILYQYQ